MPRTLTIFSADAELVNQCLAILRELGANDWKVVTSLSTMPPPDSHICIWDCAPGVDLSASKFSNPQARHFFLVRTADLEPFLASHPWAEGNIILKPAKHAVIAAYLTSVIRPDTDILSLQEDRDAMLQSLLHANLRLQEYDSQRTKFLARIAHDFRSPLTALAGFCGLLTDGHLGALSDKQKEVLVLSRNCLKRLTRMTNSLFEFSIAGERNLIVKFEKNDIFATIEQSVSEMESQAEEKGIKLAIGSLVPTSKDLHFDPSQVEQVLVNLLDNACKATPAKGSIAVFGYPFFWERRFLAGGGQDRDRRANRGTEPNSYRIDIHDSGPGIAPDQMKDIFEEYTSYFKGQERPSGGLGLAISRMIIQRHKGHIWAESRPGGATFSFVIPFMNPAKVYPDRDLNAALSATNSKGLRD